MVDVLIVDDSPTARLALRHVLESDPGLHVVGEAPTGARAERLVAELQPDLVSMDVVLGDEDGIDVASRIMERCATPILVVTGVNPEDPDLAFRAMEAGALEVVGKPPAPSSEGWEEYRRTLARLVHSLAGVPVVTRRRRPAPEEAPRPAAVGRALPRPRADSCALVAIGASTGGPPVLHAIFGGLTAPYPLPIAIAQHIAPGFVGGFARWLGAETGHDVHVCGARETLLPGRLFLAADGCHLEVLGRREIGSVKGPPIDFQRPSANRLFETATRHFGPRAAGFLLTGMGSDGARGLAGMRRAGAPTAVQAPATCAVDAMPRSALELDAAPYALTPEEIGSAIGIIGVAAGKGAPRRLRGLAPGAGGVRR